LKPLENDGWSFDAKTGCWKADRPGSRVVFAIDGRVLLMSEFHIHGPMGKVKVQVDDRPAEIVDAWFAATWGGFRLTHELARDLAPGRHRVTIEVLADKNPKSQGHEFRVLALGAAGL
jgi:hypothetical protein